MERAAIRYCKSGTATLLFGAGLFVASLRGQPPDTDCANSSVYAPEHRYVGTIVFESKPCEQLVTSTGVTSAWRLQHKIPRRALHEAARGIAAEKHHRNAMAIEHLLQSIRLDPDYVEAEVDLGAIYAKTGMPEQALEHVERALSLDPNWAVVHCNKAAVLMTLNRPEEAEASARRALRLDPSSIEASYMLASSLLRQHKIRAETVAHLAIAAQKYPRAADALKLVLRPLK